MHNKKIKILCKTSRVIFRPTTNQKINQSKSGGPFCKLPHFLRLLPPLEREVLYARPWNIYNAPFS